MFWPLYTWRTWQPPICGSGWTSRRSWWPFCTNDLTFLYLIFWPFCTCRAWRPRIYGSDWRSRRSWWPLCTNMFTSLCWFDICVLIMWPNFTHVLTFVYLQSMTAPDLRERLEESEKLMKTMSKTWEQKLEETERIHKVGVSGFFEKIWGFDWAMGFNGNNICNDRYYIEDVIAKKGTW